MWAKIAEQISQASGRPFQPKSPQHIGGGCINQAVVLTDGQQRWFVKLNQDFRLSMFAAEAEGLQELAKPQAIRIPQPLCYGTADGQAYLVLEYIEMGGSGDAELAGRQLARLHQYQADAFGWHRDNTIGSTHQPNAWQQDWIKFWRDQRLGFQLKEAARQGYGGRLQKLGEQLQLRLDQIIDHQPKPALLHGDLWGGNISYDRQGQPVIYDPAVYYGDHEAELAMTELFGGFGTRFYAAYREIYPYDAAGYRLRRTLYNLYHILNHANMFGGGYVMQSQTMMERLLAEIK